MANSDRLETQLQVDLAETPGSRSSKPRWLKRTARVEREEPPTAHTVATTFRGGEQFGPYRVLKPLGEGGMGQVHLAIRGGERVALKLLRPQLAANTAAQARLRREGELLAPLEHPRLVRLLDHGRIDEQPYLAFEYVPGLDLQTLLDRSPRDRWPLAHVIYLTAALADGLAAAHAAGVVHRDVKPANVLLTRGGEIKLADFGIALALEQPATRLTRAGRVVGTLSYLPAEVFASEGEDWSPATDVYGLACLAFLAAAGRPPRLVERVGDALEVTTLPPLRLDQDVPRAPLELVELLDRALAADPGRRPTAAELAQELRQSGLVPEFEAIASSWAEHPSWRRPDPPSGASSRSGDTTPQASSAGAVLGEVGEEPTVAMGKREPRPFACGPGTRLGPFVIVTRVGKGGMGEIYLASHQELGATYALKVLPRELALDQDSRIRFDREMRNLARVDLHPGVVRIHSNGETPDGRPWFAMEYVAGDNLSLVMRTGLALDDALDALERVLEALAYAHERRLVHRDVKPGNVLLTKDGKVKLVDFGIARALGDQSLTKTAEILGTPSCMAPEQAERRWGQVGPWTDVYAAGALLYRMIAGIEPWAGAKDPLVVYAKLGAGQRPPSPATVNREAPPLLVELCERAMSPDPKQRFPHAGAMLEALREARRAGLSPARRSPPPSVLALLAGLSLALLLAVASGRDPAHSDGPVGDLSAVSPVTSLAFLERLEPRERLHVLGWLGIERPLGEAQFGTGERAAREALIRLETGQLGEAEAGLEGGLLECSEDKWVLIGAGARALLADRPRLALALWDAAYSGRSNLANREVELGRARAWLVLGDVARAEAALRRSDSASWVVTRVRWEALAAEVERGGGRLPPSEPSDEDLFRSVREALAQGSSPLSSRGEGGAQALEEDDPLGPLLDLREDAWQVPWRPDPVPAHVPYLEALEELLGQTQPEDPLQLARAERLRRVRVLLEHATWTAELATPRQPTAAAATSEARALLQPLLDSELVAEAARLGRELARARAGSREARSAVARLGELWRAGVDAEALLLAALAAEPEGENPAALALLALLGDRPAQVRLALLRAQDQRELEPAVALWARQAGFDLVDVLLATLDPDRLNPRDACDLAAALAQDLNAWPQVLTFLRRADPGLVAARLEAADQRSGEPESPARLALARALVTVAGLPEAPARLDCWRALLQAERAVQLADGPLARLLRAQVWQGLLVKELDPETYGSLLRRDLELALGAAPDCRWAWRLVLEASESEDEAEQAARRLLASGWYRQPERLEWLRKRLAQRDQARELRGLLRDLAGSEFQDSFERREHAQGLVDALDDPFPELALVFRLERRLMRSHFLPDVGGASGGAWRQSRAALLERLRAEAGDRGWPSAALTLVGDHADVNFGLPNLLAALNQSALEGERSLDWQVLGGPAAPRPPVSLDAAPRERAGLLWQALHDPATVPWARTLLDPDLLQASPAGRALFSGRRLRYLGSPGLAALAGPGNWLPNDWLVQRALRCARLETATAAMRRALAAAPGGHTRDMRAYTFLVWHARVGALHSQGQPRQAKAELGIAWAHEAQAFARPTSRWVFAEQAAELHLDLAAWSDKDERQRHLARAAELLAAHEPPEWHDVDYAPVLVRWRRVRLAAAQGDVAAARAAWEAVLSLEPAHPFTGLKDDFGETLLRDPWRAEIERLLPESKRLYQALK